MTTTEKTTLHLPGRTEYRYAQLDPAQRDAAVAMAEKDDRPNAIGLLFTLDESGNVNAFRDTTPHIPHGKNKANNDAETLMAECLDHEAKQRKEIAMTPVRIEGIPQPLMDAIVEGTHEMITREFGPKIVRELDFSIQAAVVTYDEKTCIHTTDGKFTLSIEERAYSVLPEGRLPLRDQGRNIAWEPTHPSYESALQSAMHHLANYRANEWIRA